MDKTERESSSREFVAASPKASMSALEGLRCWLGEVTSYALVGLSPLSDGSTGESVLRPTEEPERDEAGGLAHSVVWCSETGKNVVASPGRGRDERPSDIANEEDEEEYEGGSGKSTSIPLARSLSVEK